MGLCDTILYSRTPYIMYKNIHFTETKLTAMGLIKEILKLFRMK
jgi:hypothetical protein